MGIFSPRQLGKGIGKYVGQYKEIGDPIADSVLGAYGYGYDPTQDQNMVNSWYAMQQEDLNKNSMENLVGERFNQMSDEGRAAAEASTQSAMDRQMQYGTTGSALERTARQGQMAQMDVWAQLNQQKADALLGAKQQDIAARRDLSKTKLAADLGLSQSKQSSWGRQGSMLG